MKTVEDVIADAVTREDRTGEGDWHEQQARWVTTALDAAGYEIGRKSDRAFLEGLVGWKRMRETAAQLAEDHDQAQLGAAIRALELEAPIEP